jgi:hypothetical protein
MTSWILNSASLFATTVGALLIFLYLVKSPRIVEDSLSPEVRPIYLRHQKLLTISVGLLSAWLLVQYLALILV